jgi:hypothetical protein
MQGMMEDYRPVMLAFGRDLASQMAEEPAPAPSPTRPTTPAPAPAPSPAGSVVITLTPGNAPGQVQALDGDVSIPAWLVAVLVWVLNMIVDLLGARAPSS